MGAPSVAGAAGAAGAGGPVLLDRAETAPGVRPAVTESAAPAGVERFNRPVAAGGGRSRGRRLAGGAGRRIGLWAVLAAGLAMTVTPMVFSVLRLGATTGVSMPLVASAAVVVGIIATFARRSGSAGEAASEAASASAGAGWVGPVAVGVGVAVAVWCFALIVWAVIG